MSLRMRRNALIGVATGAVALAVLLVVMFVTERDPVVVEPVEVALTVRAVNLDPIVIEPVEYLPDGLDPSDAGSARILEEPGQGVVGITDDGTATYTPDSDGPDSFTFELVDASGRTTVVVRVATSIEVTEALAASEPDVDFGEVCVWCDASTTVDIVQGDEDARIEAIEVAEDPFEHFSIEHDCEGELAETCEVQVTFAPMRPGTSDAFLEVSHSGSGDNLLVPLRGFGECETPGADRLALLEEVIGFGANTTGGADGCLVRVTSPDDEGEGTLREAAEREGPAWIVFEVSGDIDLDEYIHITADKTIDGRDSEITIEGAGLAVVDTPNVVIANLEIRDVFDDGIQVRGIETQDIWITHVTIWNVADGYLDITQGATNITVSWSRFDRSPDWPQEKALLVGLGVLSHPDAPGGPDELTRVTVHHNLFDGTEQRNPLVRGSSVHTFNNYFRGWGIYGSGVSSYGQLLSERNVYEHLRGSHADRAFTPWDEASRNDGATAFIRSVEDRLLNGASGVESHPDEVFSPDYAYVAEAPDEDLMEAILSEAGAG